MDRTMINPIVFNRKPVKQKVFAYFYFMAITILIGWVLFSCIINDPYDDRYSALILLPIIYGVFNIIAFFNVKKLKLRTNIFFFLFHSMLFVQSVLAPYYLWRLGSPAIFRSSIGENIGMAVELRIYEILILYLYFLLSSKGNADLFYEGNSQTINNGNKIDRCVFLIFSLCFALLTLYIINPGVIKLYRLCTEFFNEEFTGFNTNIVIAQYSSSLIGKFTIVTFRYIYNISRVVFPCCCAVILKEKKCKRGYVVLFTLMIIFLVNFLFMDDTLAYSISYSLVDLLFLSIILKDFTIVKNTFITIFLLVCAYFTSRFILTNTGKSGAQTDVYISKILESYFSGTTNIAASINLPNDDFFVRIKYFSYEILRGVPYASTIFGLDKTSLGVYFNKINSSVGQIVPTLGASFYYFGSVLSPTIPFVLLITAQKSYKKIYNAKSYLKTMGFITICIYCILGIGMYSLEITSVGIFSVAVPLIILGAIIKV